MSVHLPASYRALVNLHKEGQHFNKYSHYENSGIFPRRIMTQSVIVAVPVEKGVIKCILELVRLRAGGGVKTRSPRSPETYTNTAEKQRRTNKFHERQWKLD